MARLQAGSNSNQRRIGCLKMSNVYGHPKLARWPQKRVFWDQLQTKKARFTKVLWNLIFIFMTTPKFKEKTEKFYHFDTLFLRNESKKWGQKVYTTKI